MPDKSKIADLNDAFRATGHPGKVVVTAGVRELWLTYGDQIAHAVRTFNAFKENGNDPYREHDFGAFQVDGERLFWKIDYYDKLMEYGSEDPSDPAQTTRVLTIMLASEY